MMGILTPHLVLDQKYDFRNKLNRIQKGNFEHIDEELLGKIQCWGYFPKGSTYDIKQVDNSVHIWFDVITADKLLRKIGFLNAGYRLKQEDMDAIVKGLNLKPYSFEKPPIQEDSTFELNWGKELSVFIPPQNWDKILSKIKDSNIITVVGDRNVGKTTTIMNLAKELKKLGYRVHEDKESLIRLFTSREEKDRKEYYHLINNKNVFILDDLFGKSEYEPGLGNKWVYLIIDILDSAVNQSKIIIGSRIDVIDDFLFNNNELSRCNLRNEFQNSIVELKFSDYNGKNRKEIFDKNLNFIDLNDKNKEAILNKNIEQITKELLLPGDIFYFIQKAKEKADFQESELNTYIDKAKQQLNSIALDIKSLNDYEKIFFYNLYINQNFSFEDLEVIYSLCLTSNLSGRNYFVECIKKFEDNFIKIKTESDLLLTNEKIKKLEFVHSVYTEAIEKLINSDEFERRGLEEILGRLYKSIREGGIVDWKQNDARYEEIKFNSYKIVLKHYRYFNDSIRDDLVFGILSNLDFKKSEDAMWYYYYADFDTPLTFVGGNIKYLKELFFYNYNKLSDEEIKWLLSLGIQTSIIHLLAYNYDKLISKDLRNLLTTLISNTNQLERIETGKAILFSYSLLPLELTRYYDFMFDLKEELVIKQVGKAFTSWFMGAFTAINYDQKCESIDGKVFELYNNWLKNEKIISTNYDEISELYGEEYMEGWLVSSIYHYKEDNYSNLINPNKLFLY